MQLNLSINGGHRCEVRFEAHHTFQKVINLLKNNNLIPSSVKDEQITILNSQGKKFEKHDYVAAGMENAQKNKGKIDISYNSSLLRSGDSNPDPGVRTKLIDIIKKFFDRMEQKKFKDLEQYQNHPQELVKVVARFAKVYEKEVALQLFWKAAAVELAEQEKADLLNYKSRNSQEFEMVEKERQIFLPKMRKSNEEAQVKQLKAERQLLESSFISKIRTLEQALAQSQSQFLKRSTVQDFEKSRLQQSMILVKKQNEVKFSQLQKKLKGKEEEIEKREKEIGKREKEIEKMKTQMSHLKGILDIFEKQKLNWQKEMKIKEQKFKDLTQKTIAQQKQREAKMTQLQKINQGKDQEMKDLHRRIKKQQEDISGKQKQMNLAREKYRRQTDEKNQIVKNLKINKVQKDKKLKQLKQIINKQDSQFKLKSEESNQWIKSLQKQLQELRLKVEDLEIQNKKILERTQINPIFEEQNMNDQSEIINLEDLSKTVSVNIELLHFENILKKKTKQYKTIIRYDQSQRYAAQKVNKQLEMYSNFFVICKTKQGQVLGGFVFREKREEKPKKNTKALKEEHSSAFLFSFGSTKDKLTMFPLKENQNPLTRDEDFLIFGNEEFCLDYGSAELSRMDPINIQEKDLKYHNSKKFIQELRGRSMKLEWYMIFTCLQ